MSNSVEFDVTINGYTYVHEFIEITNKKKSKNGFFFLF